MKVVPPARPPLPVPANRKGLKVEQVVDFSDFVVERITLPASTIYNRQSFEYHLLIVIQGSLMTWDVRVAEEEAVLLPASSAGFQIESTENQQVVFLVAHPKHKPSTEPKERLS